MEVYSGYTMKSQNKVIPWSICGIVMIEYLHMG